MPERQTAPYGSWSSPITSDLIVASTVGLGGIQLDGTDVYWLESRPKENGRSVIVRRAADGTSIDVTPPVARAGEATFSVRTRVHEYGGGSYLVSDGVVYFCNDADQRLGADSATVAHGRDIQQRGQRQHDAHSQRWSLP